MSFYCRNPSFHLTVPFPFSLCNIERLNWTRVAEGFFLKWKWLKDNPSCLHSKFTPREQLRKKNNIFLWALISSCFSLAYAFRADRKAPLIEHKMEESSTKHTDPLSGMLSGKEALFQHGIQHIPVRTISTFLPDILIDLKILLLHSICSLGTNPVIFNAF